MRTRSFTLNILKPTRNGRIHDLVSSTGKGGANRVSRASNGAPVTSNVAHPWRGELVHSQKKARQKIKGSSFGTGKVGGAKKTSNRASDLKPMKRAELVEII